MKIELEIIANKNCEDVFLNIFLDDRLLLATSAKSVPQKIAVNLAETTTDHALHFIMQGKNKTHTRIDQQGNILDDVYFVINKIEFEELDMHPIFCQGRARYRHSFNTDQQFFLDEFYGQLGCNGTVSLEFSQPFFLWLSDRLE